MKFVQHLIVFACCLDFSFSSSEWLSSAENLIADTASHFAFFCMFTIAPWLQQNSAQNASNLVVQTKPTSLQDHGILPLAQTHHQHSANILYRSVAIYPACPAQWILQPGWLNPSSLSTRYPFIGRIPCRPYPAQDHQSLPISCMLSPCRH